MNLEEPPITRPTGPGSDAWWTALLVVGVSAACHRGWQPGFDEWWHMFYAGANPLDAVWDDLRQDSHPPLGYLMLRPLGQLSPFWMRLPGILSVAWAAGCLHGLARSLGFGSGARWAFVLVTALSPPWIAAGLAVRGYGLGMLAFVVLLRSAADPRPRGQDRGWTYLVATSLAAALLPWVVAIGVALLPILALSVGLTSPRTNLGRRATPILVCGAMSLGLVLVWLRTAVRPDPHFWLSQHLPPKAGPTLSWWMEALASQWNVFVPFPRGPFAWILGPGLLIGLAHSAVRCIRQGERGRAFFPLLVVMAFGAIAAAAALGRYPFGGMIRHQALLLPAVWAALFVFTQPLRRSRMGGHLTLTALVTLGCAQALSGYGPAPGPDEFSSKPLWDDDRLAWASQLRKGDALVAAKYSSIGLYAWSHLDGAVWVRSATHADGGTTWDTFEAGNGDESRTIVRITSVWTWGRGDAITTAQIASKLLRDRPDTQRVWLYVRHPGRVPDAHEAKTALVSRLAENGLSLVDSVQRPHAWIWCVAR